MLSQCLVPSVTKKEILTRSLWDSNQLQPFKYNIFIKVYQYILKSLETFLISNYFYIIAKKYKYEKKKKKKNKQTNKKKKKKKKGQISI